MTTIGPAVLPVGWALNVPLSFRFGVRGRRLYRAALDNRSWAIANSACQGWAEAMATLIRRTEIVTLAPSFRSLRRIVPQVALASIERKMWRR